MRLLVIAVASISSFPTLNAFSANSSFSTLTTRYQQIQHKSPVNLLSNHAMTLSALNVYSFRNNERSQSLHFDYNRKRNGRSKTAMASTMPHADIAVRLDQPILSPSSPQIRNNVNPLFKSLFTILLSDVVKTACIAVFLAFLISFISKSKSQALSTTSPIFTSLKHVYKLVQGQIQKVTDGVKRLRGNNEGIPMVFETDDDGNAEWGVCTLEKKTQLGRSQFVKYDFKLPKADNVLNLALGQKVSLCCLDNKDRVAKNDYYLFSPKKTKGSFSILAREDGAENGDGMSLAKGQGDFTKVLSQELEVGDEVALQPGPRTLSYKGEYLPVTDMVYIASGSGIAPVLDQVRAVLPSGSSSVQSVSVIWVNSNEEDFDVALSSLEDEYFKYSTKLAVSCVVKENDGKKLKQNEEVEDALPPFEPGTMAVIAGPKRFSSEARSMLMGSGYPEECICVLP